jgi:hypothetical protein
VSQKDEARELASRLTAGRSSAHAAGSTARRTQQPLAHMPRLPAPPSIPSRADTLCSSVPAATRGADIAMLAVSSAAATLAITLRWCESGTLGSASCPENPAPNIHRPRRGGFGAATPATSPPFGRSSKKKLGLEIAGVGLLSREERNLEIDARGSVGLNYLRVACCVPRTHHCNRMFPGRLASRNCRRQPAGTSTASPISFANFFAR